jgi:hypothetical protein
MEEQAMKHNKINYILILAIVMITNIISLYLYSAFFQKDEGENNTIVLENISNLNTKINTLTELSKLNNAAVKTTDRLDASLVQEFGEDSQFLEKIAKLKKQIIKRELESKIITLENEKLARNSSITDGTYADGYKKQSVEDVFEIMMINATTQKAVIRVEDNIASVGINDNIRGFKIININANQVIMENPEGETEILGLSYLTKKIYTDTDGGKNVK